METERGERGPVRLILWLLAVGALAVLGAAAVWMGGLNQDEGWYLYAANLVAGGQIPYRDFAYTQGPVLPYVYSALTGVWQRWGILGARVLTLAIGVTGILFAAALAHRLAPRGRKGSAALTAFLLLGCNLYHLYYVAIPKTYALAGLFVIVGFWLLSMAEPADAIVPRASSKNARSLLLSAVAGLFLAFAAGTRISLGAILAVVGLRLLLSRDRKTLVAFCLGGFSGLAIAYGPFLLDAAARGGLVAAQRYHSARGGFDPVWTVGSLSRLVRWYLPVFVILGLGIAGKAMDQGAKEEDPSEDGKFPCPASDSEPRTASLLFWSFLAVFAVQMLAPFPYEDYQVPVMGLLAVFAAVRFARLPFRHAGVRAFGHFPLLLAMGLSFASSFGSPLLEKWMTNGQDRFWTLKKKTCELQQLRNVAKRIRAIDPDGTMLLTQDLYLAIEAGRKVPKGLEMGPFAILSDAEWKKLLALTAPIDCRVAALSGYAFAIEPPVCRERSLETQLEYWSLLKRNYELVEREESFGQNATSLLILKRKK